MPWTVPPGPAGLGLGPGTAPFALRSTGASSVSQLTINGRCEAHHIAPGTVRWLICDVDWAPLTYRAMKRLSLPLAWLRGMRLTTRMATAGFDNPQRRSAVTIDVVNVPTSGRPTVRISAPLLVCVTWYSEMRGSVPST